MKKRFWCQQCRATFGEEVLKDHQSGRLGRHDVLEQRDINQTVRGIVSGCKSLIQVKEAPWESTFYTIGDLDKKGSPLVKLDIVDGLDASFQIIRHRIDTSDHVALFLLDELKKRVVIHH